MIYTEHPVTPHLLARLWANLWDRGKQEFKLWGTSIDDGFHLFMTYVENAHESAILCADGVPIVVAGVCPEGASSCFTFMQATQDFEKHYRQIIKWLRRRTQDQKGDVYIYSVLVHPKAARFFHAIGYNKDPYWVGQTAINEPLFRFRKGNHVW